MGVSVMRYGSVCSGIEAASVAWGPLGWEAAWFSEIDSAASEVLKHHWPSVENLGDMAKLPALIALGAVDAPAVFVGGTPCQAFSLAGSRKSLSDARGNLTLTYVEIANAIDGARAAAGLEPCVTLWENVVGCLNTEDNAFGYLLAGLAGENEPLVPAGRRWANAGYVSGPRRKIAWRVLDAQYFGLAQRRERVFLISSARHGFCPAEVLFEREGDARVHPPLGQKEDGQAASVLDETRCLECGVIYEQDGPLEGCPVCGALPSWCADVCGTLSDGAHHGGGLNGQDAGSGRILVHAGRPRRLTPDECERLQGLPGKHTDVPFNGKPMPDGSRMKMMANTFPVPVVRWLGQRINQQVT